MPSDRLARFYKSPINPDESREPAARDRDRVLYTSAFRRLAGVTQVVGPLEGHVFHNRLTHTLEVAQIARRLAERLAAKHPRIATKHGLDPEIAEAAALAHDLGHPPFGHVAEAELDRCVRSHGVREGFEGNAQSFRVATRLCAHRSGYAGLNLTRAALNAILKYPWLRGRKGTRKHEKFGAYSSERSYLRFARAGATPDKRSLEALIMDHADAVAYSVHDMDDFFRAGLIPIEMFKVEAGIDQEIKKFKASTDRVAPKDVDKYAASIKRMVAAFPTQRHSGAWAQRIILRTCTAQLIDDFVRSVQLRDKGGYAELAISPALRVRMRFLQNLVWRYVIDNPRLATQQHGQKLIVRSLFETYLAAIKRRDVQMLPTAFEEAFHNLGKIRNDPTSIGTQKVRLAADIVASLTDGQAVNLYNRLTGSDSGSVLDHVAG